uniref:Uncharacterized protein n=1 Tax=Anguilla anguilla TaxID=7936 RepID=A0A0E9UAA3_ANGAN
MVVPGFCLECLSANVLQRNTNFLCSGIYFLSH